MSVLSLHGITKTINGLQSDSKTEQISNKHQGQYLPNWSLTVLNKL